MQEICAVYKGLLTMTPQPSAAQIREDMISIYGFTKQEIRDAQRIVDPRVRSGAGVDHTSGAGENYWVSKEWKDLKQSITEPNTDPMKQQVGGDWYTKLAIQPAEYATANQMTFLEGLILKYISRWRNKDGIKDLRKIQQTVDLIIHLEKL